MMMQSLFDFLSGRSRSLSRSRSSSSSKKIIIDVELKPGGLSDYGYDSRDPARQRRLAIMRAVRAEGYRPIIGRLNLLSVFNKNRSPHFAKIFKSDQRWLSRRYEEVKSRGSSSRSSSRSTRGRSFSTRRGARRTRSSRSRRRSSRK